MPRQPRQRSDSGIHHVMLRGINRQLLFHEEDDYHRFLRYLSVSQELSGCSVLAYCLMPNHVHLVVHAGDEPIGDMVKRLGVRYAWWHNRRYDGVGHVFQDRFKSRPVDDDSYLVTLLRYVWNNPVKAGLASTPRQYRWNSLSPNAVVAESALLAFIDPITLAELTRTAEPDAPDPGLRLGRLTDDDASKMLARFYRQSGKVGLTELPVVEQRLVVANAMRCGVSIRQLARITGVNRSFLQRLAVASEPPGTVPGGTT